MKRTIEKIDCKDYEYTTTLLQVHCDKLTAAKIIEFIGKLKAEIETENEAKNETN